MTMDYGMAGIIAGYGVRDAYPQARAVSGGPSFLGAVAA